MAESFFELDLLLQFPYQDLPQPILVDVGAHIGFVSKAFAKQGWRIVAFEPEPSNHRELTKNLQQFKNITIINKAVADRADKSVTFYVSREHWGIHSLKAFHETHQPITVEAVRLDETLQNLEVNRVSLLKVDTEGADLWVLQSCDFNRVRPELVMCEFGDGRSQSYFDYNHHDVVTHMKPFGYRAYVSEWKTSGRGYARKGQKESPHQFLGCNPYPLDHEPAWGNLIFVRQDRIGDFDRLLANYFSRAENPIYLPQSCPVCDSKFVAYVRTVLTRRTKKYLPLYYCMECESFFNPSGYQLDDSQWKKTKDWYVSVESRDMRFAENLMKELSQKYPRAQSILQIGCGTGTLLSVARKYFPRVTGYDANPHAISYGRSKYNLDLHWDQFWKADKTEPHDLLLCISLLDQKEQPQLLFEELAKAARRDGSALFVSVPFLEREKWNYILTADPYEKGTPFADNDIVVTHFSHKGLLALGHKHGARKSTFLQTSWQGYIFEF